MKRLMSFSLFLAIGFAAAAGCGEKATSKTTQTIKSPEGTTTVEHKDTVKKSNENAPNP